MKNIENVELYLICVTATPMGPGWVGWWVSQADEEAVGHRHPCICGTDKYAKPEVDQKHALSLPYHTLLQLSFSAFALSLFS